MHIIFEGCFPAVLSTARVSELWLDPAWYAYGTIGTKAFLGNIVGSIYAVKIGTPGLPDSPVLASQASCSLGVSNILKKG